MFSDLTADRLNEAAAAFTDVFLNAPFCYDWIQLESMERYFRDMYAAPNFKGYMAVTGGRLTAAVCGLYNDYFAAPTYEIKEIIVARHLQRDGLGGRLLAYAEERLKADGAAAVTLMTRADIGAYQFYLKHGYQLSESAVNMHKLL